MSRNSLFFCFCFLVTALQGFASSHRDFVIVTSEKCGTHLLTYAIEKLLSKPVHHWYVTYREPDQVQKFIDNAKDKNMILQTHSRPTPDFISLLHKNNYRVLFLTRDPRDQMVSLVHYLESGWKYGPKVQGKYYGHLPFDEKLLEVITGNRYGLSALLDIPGRKMPWLKQSPDFVCVVRFENLVGDEGGGSRELQLNEIRKIVAFLEIDLSEEEIQQRSQGLFGTEGADTTTFRKGVIGEWKHAFKPHHVKAFKLIFGKKLIEMGYEKNLKWTN